MPQYEEEIKGLMLSEFQMEDELVWLKERTGTYSTNTAYALSKLNGGVEDPEFNWKLCIWQVKTSPKFKHFLWNLNNYAMEVEGRCKRCGIVETERHILLQCPFTARVWELVPAVYKPDPNTINTLAALLQACGRLVNLPLTDLNETALFPWIFWYLWTCRSKLLFENRGMVEHGVVSLALKEARIWQVAQKEKAKPLPIKKLQVPGECGSNSEIQCFVDAAWNAGTRCGGFGCIFKYINNRTLHQCSSSRSNVGSTLVAEALAVKAGLKAARLLGLRKLTVRSDFKSLVMAISNNEKIVEAQGVLFDIC